MKQPSQKLEQYPGLSRWFTSQPSSPPPKEDSVELFVWNSCYALTLDEDVALSYWAQSFRQFLEHSSSPLDDYLVADEVFNTCDTALVDFVGDFVEHAVLTDHCPLYFSLMSDSADKTGIAAFRFLSAWIAMNTEDLETCVIECEKVDEPYSSLHTIHGQALLELGRIKEALEVLEVAVSLAPNELLAWFQLAKGSHVLGENEEAINALDHCRRLAPQSAEVALFYSMVSLETSENIERLAFALELMGSHLTDDIDSAALVCAYLDLAFELRDKEATKILVTKANWPSLLADTYFTKNLAKVLKKLHTLEWNDVASDILTHLTSKTA